MPDGTRELQRQVWRDGSSVDDCDTVVCETPVALVYNGISHAVMMATPVQLPDLALGFSLSEGILDRPDQLLGLDVTQRDQGIELAMEITAGAFAGLKERRRNLAGRTGCGLCGIESLEQLLPLPQPVESTVRISHEAIQKALTALAQQQTLKAATGGVHGAAWCLPDGEIALLREDVGRHNALDKLLGAMAATGGDEDGFVLVTSRASYEMVAKLAACGREILVAVSAPTDLAVEYAREVGVTLLAFAQPGRQVVYSHSERIEEGSPQ
jgi:FdhD protein